MSTESNNAEKLKPLEPSENDRRKMAECFMQDSGRTPEQIAQELHGINFSKAVDIYKAQQGEIFGQVQVPERNSGEPAGNYFFKPGADTERLGVSGESSASKRRELDFVQADRDVVMLQSTAADINSWERNPSGSMNGELYYGGETQYFTSDKSFNRIADSARIQEKPVEPVSPPPAPAAVESSPTVQTGSGGQTT